MAIQTRCYTWFARNFIIGRSSAVPGPTVVTAGTGKGRSGGSSTGKRTTLALDEQCIRGIQLRPRICVDRPAAVMHQTDGQRQS